MGIVKFPAEIIERNEVVCHDGPLSARLIQSQSGSVVVDSFLPPPSARGTKGPIEASGKVHIGDALLSVNDVPVELMTFEEVLELIQDVPRPFTLTFGRSSSVVGSEIQVTAGRFAIEQQQQEEQARMQLLQEQEQNRRIGKTVATKSNEPNVYTARDFKAFRFTRFQQTVAVSLLVLILIVTALFWRWSGIFAIEEERAFNEFTPEHVTLSLQRNPTINNGRLGAPPPIDTTNSTAL